MAIESYKMDWITVPTKLGPKDLLMEGHLTVVVGKEEITIAKESLDDHPINGKLTDMSKSVLKQTGYVSIREDGTLIKTKIQNGSYGTVYHLDGTEYIIKIYSEEWSFIRELAFYRLINHVYKEPEDYGLPKLFGYGNRYIICRKYDRELNKKDEWAIEPVYRAVFNLHRLGIVHRDLKFSNIMVWNESVIIIDLGLSSWLPFDSFRVRETSIQTMWFRAPEVAIDTRYTSSHSDAMDNWSVGVMVEAIKCGKILVTTEISDELIATWAKLFEVSKDKFVRSVHGTEPLCYQHNRLLITNPLLRGTVAEILGEPAITVKSIIEMCPAATVKVKLGLSDFRKCILQSENFYMAITAFSYMEEGFDMRDAIICSRYLGSSSTDVPLLPTIVPNLLILSTLHYLVSEIPQKEISEYAKMVAVFCVDGNIDHRRQAKWIAQKYKGQEPDDTELTSIYSNKLIRISPKLWLEINESIYMMASYYD